MTARRIPFLLKVNVKLQRDTKKENSITVKDKCLTAGDTTEENSITVKEKCITVRGNAEENSITVKGK